MQYSHPKLSIMKEESNYIEYPANEREEALATKYCTSAVDISLHHSLPLFNE
jgi:hypothetical protein